MPPLPPAGDRIEGTSTIGVLICTYQRPVSLGQCLDGLARQTRLPDEVIAVCRQSDTATRNFLKSRVEGDIPIRMVAVAPPGLVAARNAGLQACRTELLAIIDDDVVPHREWLDRLFRHFAADPTIGGVGGRDHVHDGERFDERLAAHVGMLQWFGRVIGNHHLGYGGPRVVRVLKGANMSYRASAIAGLEFDRRLRGQTTQPHDDLGFSLAVGRQDWKLIYDPAVLVYHYAGRSEQRAYSSLSQVAPQELRDTAFNLVVALWNELSPPRRIAFGLWSVLIGTSTDPGLVQAVRYTSRLGAVAWQRFWLTQQGKAAAYWALISRALLDIVASARKTGGRRRPSPTPAGTEK